MNTVAFISQFQLLQTVFAGLQPEPYKIPAYFSSGSIETGNITQTSYTKPDSQGYIRVIKHDLYIPGNYIIFTKSHKLYTTSDFQNYTLLAGSTDGFQDGIERAAKFSAVWGWVHYGVDLMIIPEASFFAGTRILNRSDNSVSLLHPINLQAAAQAGNITDFVGDVDGSFDVAKHSGIKDIVASATQGLFYVSDAHNRKLKVINMNNGSVYAVKSFDLDPNKLLRRPAYPDKMFIGFSSGDLRELNVLTLEVKRVIEKDSTVPSTRRFNHDGWTISDAVVEDVEHLNSWTNDTMFIFSDLIGMNVIDFKTGWVTSICEEDNSLLYSRPYEPGPAGVCVFDDLVVYTIVDSDKVLMFEKEDNQYYTMPYTVRAEPIWTTEYYTQTESADFFLGVEPRYAIIPPTITNTLSPPIITSDQEKATSTKLKRSNTTSRQGQTTTTQLTKTTRWRPEHPIEVVRELHERTSEFHHLTFSSFCFSFTQLP